MGEYARAAALGIKSFVQSVLNWRENPYITIVGERLWGSWRLLPLVCLTVAAVAVSPFFPSFERIAGFIPPAVFLTWIPSSIRDLLWSVPAFFGFVVAWRVRRFRQNDKNLFPDLVDAGESNNLIFEAGATPIAVAAFVLAAGLELVQPLMRLAQGLDGGWYGLTSHLESATWSLVVVAISAGVMSVNSAVGKGVRQVFGAGVTLFGIRLGIGFAAPWIMGWWTYLPIPYINQLGESSSTLVFILFNLCVASAAWIMLRERTAGQHVWMSGFGDDDQEALSEPDLPPLPSLDAKPQEEG